MRLLFLFISLIWSLCAFAQFLPQTEDIPLMPEMTIQDSDVFSFDSPSGQILSIDAKISASPSAVQQFYADSLSAMGWKMIKPDTYMCGSDTLSLSFPKSNTIHFDITLSTRN